MVYGTSALQEGFNAIRRRVLCRGRDPATLRREVSEMRAKMRQHLASKQSDVFDIKTGEGGITDIEFLAQYLVLRHAAEKPELTRWSDNVRIFELMAQHGIIDGDDADGLRASYTTLRDTLHHLALPGRVPVAQFARERALIGRCWRQWLD